MTTTTTIALDVATILAVTLACTAVLKALTEVWVDPEARLHDPLIQLEALLVGVGWSFLFSWAFGPFNRAAVVQAVTSVILGVVGGAGGIGLYHVGTAVKGSAAGSTAAAVPSGQAAAPDGAQTIVAPEGATVTVVSGPRGGAAPSIVPPTQTQTTSAPQPPPGEVTPPSG